MREPFNLAAHDWLIANGYAYTAHDEDWYETGDAESGPKMDGHPAFDEYQSDEDYVYIDANDTGIEPRDREAELFFEQQANHVDGLDRDDLGESPDY